MMNFLLYDAINTNDLQLFMRSAKHYSRENFVDIVLGPIRNESHFPSRGESPFIKACRKGQIDIVSYCIEEYDIDFTRHNKYMVNSNITPLLTAAKYGHLDLVKYLVRLYAKSEDCSNDLMIKHFSDSLLVACQKNRIHVASYLLEVGADVNALHDNGITCLMHASRHTNLDFVKLLVEKGANINVKRPTSGHTALHYAAKSGKVEIISYLLNHNLICTEFEGQTPLFIAALFGHLPAVTFISNHPRTHYTLLEEITVNELLGAVILLRGYDIPKGIQHLIDALQLRNSCMVLERPITTPLSEYLQMFEATTVEELRNLKSPIDLRIQSLLVLERHLGPTCFLKKDFIFCTIEIFQRIKAYQICVTLLMYCLESENKQKSSVKFTLYKHLGRMFALMCMNNQSIDDCLETSLKCVYADLVGMDSSRTSYEGLLIVVLTFLKMAALEPHRKRKMVPICKAILELQPSYNGQTLLHFACGNELIWCLDAKYYNLFPVSPLINFLLECGANPNSIDLYNNTPLHKACAERYELNKDIVQALLSYGAHADCRNNRNISPLSQIATKASEKFKYDNLQCMAARAVQKHCLKFVGLVPTVIEKLIKIH